VTFPIKVSSYHLVGNQKIKLLLTILVRPLFMGFLLFSKYKYCFFLWFQDIPGDFFLAITTIIRSLGMYDAHYVGSQGIMKEF
jgi:hypothetical protein